MTEATAQRLRNALGWLGFPLAGMLCGLIFGILEGKDDTWIAMVYGAGVGGVMIAFAMGRLFPRVSRWLRAQAAPIYVGGTMLVWSALSFVSYALMGLLLMVADQWFGILAGHQDHGPVMWLVLRFDVLLFSMGVSAVGGLLFRIRDLIGTRVFLALLVGRYHRPTREERIFLLVDVAGWTSTAERLGELGATDYLGQILFTMGSPVRRNRGAIDRYVGDQAIISWNISCGARQAARQAARAITCTFDILEAVERAGPDFIRRFGEAPRVRAVMHVGTVVVAELGDAKHEIAFIGDTMNTAARLEGLAKTLKVPVLVSEAVLALAPLPAGVDSRPLGAHMLRGRTETVDVYELSRPAQRPARAPTEPPARAVPQLAVDVTPAE